MQLFVQPVPNTLACTSPLPSQCALQTEACLRVAPDRPVALLRELVNHSFAVLPVVVELLTCDLHEPVKGKTKSLRHEEQRHVFARSSWSACFGAMDWGWVASAPSPRSGRH